MLFFVEGPDRAGKSRFINECKERFGWPAFSLPYPASLSEIIGDKRLADYFLGGNTFLINAYQMINKTVETNLLIHRGFISEYAYGPLFGRPADSELLKWWIGKWPIDTCLVLMDINYETYLKRHHNDHREISRMEWGPLQLRYMRAWALVEESGFPVAFVSGEAPFEYQWKAVREAVSPQVETLT